MHHETKQTVGIIIVAAGSGQRTGLDDQGRPKQYQRVAEIPVITNTIEALLKAPNVENIVCVIRDEHFDLYQEATQNIKSDTLSAPAYGSSTRQLSVLAGLEKLAEKTLPDLILIHDAVRPDVSAETLQRVCTALKDHIAVLPALPVVDTIKRVEDATVRDTLDRATLWAAQTPQGFQAQAIYDAHQTAKKQERIDFTDDCGLMEWAGHTIHIVEGNSENTKLTTADDMKAAQNRALLTKDNKMHKEYRIGNGFDVHAFDMTGDAVILCGITIPHTAKLKGHSDADVGLHTITDALYGAMADGDIGHHFPPSDPQWKGASSDTFLIHACKRLEDRGGRIVNIDLTFMCEAPKIGIHREPMRQKVAEICTVSMDRVSIKATTTEKLGFTGRGEGIAASATVLIEIPLEEIKS